MREVLTIVHMLIITLVAFKDMCMTNEYTTILIAFAAILEIILIILDY